MSQTYECDSCGVVRSEPEGLCHPSLSEVTCRSSDDIMQKTSTAMCEPLDKQDLFSCAACTGVSPEANLLCAPVPRDSKAL